MRWIRSGRKLQSRLVARLFRVENNSTSDKKEEENVITVLLKFKNHRKNDGDIPYRKEKA